MNSVAISGRPKICMLLRGDFTHNLRVRKQAQSLAKAGWEVTVIALALGEQQSGPTIDSGGFTLWRVQDSLFAYKRSPATASADGPMPRNFRKKRRSGAVNLVRLALNRIVVMFRMIRVIGNIHPDVVESHNVNTLPAGFLGSRIIGARLVYDAHEINTEREGYYAKIRKLIHLIEKVVLPHAALIMSTTDMRAEHYQKSYLLPTKPLVIQNKPRYTDTPRNNRLRENLGIPDDRLVVLYQGGLQEGRGLHNLVRVAAQVKGAAFVFLGSGAQEESLRALAVELGVQDKVYFHPAVSLEVLPSFTASADIGVQILRNTCLNHYTTDSNKIFEYGMGGLAVVASNFPEIRRIILRHGYGVLVDPENIIAIARAIQQLVDDKEYRDKLQSNAISSRHELSWESQEQAFLDAIEHSADPGMTAA